MGEAGFGSQQSPAVDQDLKGVVSNLTDPVCVTLHMESQPFQALGFRALAKTYPLHPVFFFLLFKTFINFSRNKGQQK